jgi:hypothetical protein
MQDQIKKCFFKYRIDLSGNRSALLHRSIFLNRYQTDVTDRYYYIVSFFSVIRSKIIPVQINK